ncbi:MAG: hypothetical protein ACPL7J_04240, partial [Desulfomonilaceae bacterium]
ASWQASATTVMSSIPPHVIPSIPRCHFEHPTPCHFGYSLSVISSAARNLEPNAKISLSPPLTFVRVRLHRNDKGVRLWRAQRFGRG